MLAAAQNWQKKNSSLFSRSLWIRVWQLSWQTLWAHTLKIPTLHTYRMLMMSGSVNIRMVSSHLFLAVAMHTSTYDERQSRTLRLL